VTPHVDYAKVAPDAIRALMPLQQYVNRAGLEPALLELVKLRASYMNGCAYCVDMHALDARAMGETEQRIYAAAVWRDAPFYTARERAALAWTEAVTEMRQGAAPDAVRAEVGEHFDDRELVALTMAIIAINAWNRLNVPFHNEAGHYTPRAAAPAGAVA
jgi:AhpD family alkylhydroperoxidase